MVDPVLQPQDAAERFKYLEHIYTNVISELDPLYVDPYLVGAMILEHGGE